MSDFKVGDLAIQTEVLSSRYARVGQTVIIERGPGPETVFVRILSPSGRQRKTAYNTYTRGLKKL